MTLTLTTFRKHLQINILPINFNIRQRTFTSSLCKLTFPMTHKPHYDQNSTTPTTSNIATATTTTTTFKPTTASRVTFAENLNFQTIFSEQASQMNYGSITLANHLLRNSVMIPHIPTIHRTQLAIAMTTFEQHQTDQVIHATCVYSC